MGILKNIEWTDTDSNLIVWKYGIVLLGNMAYSIFIILLSKCF